MKGEKWHTDTQGCLSEARFEVATHLNRPGEVWQAFVCGQCLFCFLIELICMCACSCWCKGYPEYKKTIKGCSFKRMFCILIIVRIRHWKPALKTCDAASQAREAKEKLCV